ncbi:Pentatricopeptide repeat-containing protein, partial [Glycine soja]
RAQKNQKKYCARNDMYNMMIRLHARHNRTDQARGLFFEMQEWRCKPDVETYNALISAHVSFSLVMLESGNRIGFVLVSDLVLICSMHHMNGVGPDLVTHNIILSAIKSGAQYSKALSYFELMKGTHIRPGTTTLNIVIHCLVKLRQYDKAIDIFNSMREKKSDCILDVVTFTSIIHLYSVSQNPQKAREIFDRMKRNQLKPNLVSYNALIDAYGSNGLLADAIKILREMEQERIQPNVVSICTLLAACGRCSRKVKIDTVLTAADMRGIKLNTACINMRKKKIKTDSVTYTVLISGCCKMSKYGEALSFMEEMMHLKLPLSKEVYSSVICACSKQAIDAFNAAENLAKAYALFEEIEASGIKLDTIARAALMRSFNKGGQPGRVLSLAEITREKKFLSLMFLIVIFLLQDWRTAVDMIKYIEPSLPVISSGCLNQFLHSLGKSGKIELCADVNLNTYSILLKNLLSSGNWRKYLEMEDAGIHPSNAMYHDISSFSQKCCGDENAAVIKERLESLKRNLGSNFHKATM